ncbi:hypothetical protein [Parapedobacter lycopersici]|uniref:hypothetical protein n=1 Tax=Parapedobacter lycopersici TaxID=1864939 RepID=UPI00333F54FD
MKHRSKQLILLLAIITGLYACKKKETTPTGVASRVKTFNSEAQLRQALGSFVTGYNHTLFAYGDHEEGDHDFYMAWANTDFGDKPYGATRGILLFRYEDDRTKEQILDRYYANVVVDDPRLNNPLYSNILILTTGNKTKSTWFYRLFALHRGPINKIDEIELSGGFSIVRGAAGEAEWFEQAPEPPTDKEAVTALLNLLEPVPVD